MSDDLSTPRPDRGITLVLDRLRSAHNTGNIFRLAEAVGVTEIVGCGYTPLPPHPKLAKTAMGTDARVPCRHFATSLEAVQTLRAEGMPAILAVDNIPGASPVWDRVYPARFALVLGNEALGIAPETVDACDGAILLPMFGGKASINVGNACAAVLYLIEYLRSLRR